MAENNYNPHSHFFVDHAVLREVQESMPLNEDINKATDAFGPVAGDPENQYRTTSFVRTDSEDPIKVFAICKGRILVQPVTNDEAKVNLILKPEESYAPIKVKYFIYRGVTKSDLVLNSNTLTPIDETVEQPTFLKELWETFKRYNTSIPDTSTPTDFPPSLIGYDLTMPTTTLIDEVFNQYDAFQLPKCSVGMHLGYFTEKIGLDIVLDDGDYQLEYQQELFRLDLEYARKSEHIFDISTISNPDSTKEVIYQARYREYILRFMDAAAFWGSHINCGTIVLYNESLSQNPVKINTAESIYTNILNRYQTKHTVYIHIMAERGRSYNYYDDPNNKRKVLFDLQLLSPSNSLANYETFKWPILLKNYDTLKETNKIYGYLEYEIDNSINQTERFIAFDVITPNLGTQRFPKKYSLNSQERGTTRPFGYTLFAWANKVCASFVFISCNLKQTFPLVDYFNELWTVNIKPTFTLHNNDNFSSWCTYDRNKIVNLDDVLSTGGVMQNKVFFDTGKKLSGSIPITKKRRLYVAALKKNTTDDAEYTNLNIGNFTSCFLNNLEYSEYFRILYGNGFSVYKGTFADGSEVINTLTLFHDKNLLRRKSFFQLGITEEEYEAIIANLPNDADNIFFYLNEVLPFENPEFLGSDVVRKFKLKLSYESNMGTINTHSPLMDIFIYTIDGCYFFSKEYSDYQSFYTELANAKVEFRVVPDSSYTPIPKYNGEFGFDWLRIGDNFNTADDPKYSDIIEGGYERPKAGDLNTEYENKYEAFKALKQEYFSLPTKKNDDYNIIPYLSLFSKEFHDRMQSTHNLPYEANLRVLVEIGENLNRLEFDYDGTLFNVKINNSDNTQRNILSDKNICPKSESIDKTIKITCLRDFAESQLIKIWAYPAEVTNKQDAKLAGAIFVNKNDVQTRKTLDIALIKVKTNMNNATPPSSSHPIGQFMDAEKINLKNTLHQYFIVENIEEVDFDITDVTKYPEFQKSIPGGFFDADGNILLYNSRNNKLHRVLKDQFLSPLLSNAELSSYFLCFAMDLQSAPDPKAFGEIDRIGSALAVLYKAQGYSTTIPRDTATLNHETMHGLGLYHTFRESNGLIPPSFLPIAEPAIKYIYPNTIDPFTGSLIPNFVNATNNVMSYNSDAISLWQWQKKFINLK